MRKSLTSLIGVLLFVLSSASVEAKLKVFACFPEWQALAKQLGGDAVEVFATVRRRHRIPVLLKGAAGGLNRGINIGISSEGDLCEMLLGSGVVGLKDLSGCGFLKFTVEEETIAFLYLDLAGVLGCRGIGPEVVVVQLVVHGCMESADGEVVR